MGQWLSKRFGGVQLAACVGKQVRCGGGGGGGGGGGSAPVVAVAVVS